MSEELTFNTNEDIVFQIEMLSYIRFNDQIASMNENLGDIYSYKDIDEMKAYQTEYEKRLSYQAIQQLQQENTQLKEVILVGTKKEVALQEQITALKQQLKDKDEKISKVREYCNKEKNEYVDDNDISTITSYGVAINVLEILESNKED